MSDFSLLWGSILRSSIWVKESKEARLVWVTLLALKNFDGVIKSSMIGLADAAKVSPEECKAAIEIFLAPDPNDTSKVEEGRRIRVVPGGWQIVNNDMYRFSSEAKREFWRQQKAEQRAREALAECTPKPKRAGKSKSKGPTGGEMAYKQNADNFGVEEADRMEGIKSALNGEEGAGV